MHCTGNADRNDDWRYERRTDVNSCHLESQKRLLEKKEAKLERKGAESADLELQLNDLRQEAVVRYPPDVEAPESRSYDSFSESVDVQYDRVLCNVDRLIRDNNKLQCSVDLKTAKEWQLVDEIKRLEHDKTTVAKCTRALQDNVGDEMARAKALKKRQADLEQAIERKVADLEKARCELRVAESDAKRKTEQRLELERLNDKQCRALRKQTAEGRRRESELAEVRKTGLRRLAQADRSLSAMAKKLAAACVAAADWTADRKRVADEHRKLKTVGDGAKCRAQAELDALADERRLLDVRLRELQCRYAEAESDNRRLTAVAWAETDRLAGLMSDEERMERRAGHRRLVFAVKILMAETEKALFETLNTVERLKLTMVWAEMDQLRKLRECMAAAAAAEAAKTCSIVTCAVDTDRSCG